MEPTTQFQASTIEQTFRIFETSSKGLNSIEVERRLALFGRNVIREEKISKWKILLRQFNSILIYILILASLVSIIVGELTDFLVIMFIVVINSLIGFWQEVKAESSLAALKKLTESQNSVVRNGRPIMICSSELVPGDYIVLHDGEVVTADIRLVDTSGLMVDESPMTGESIPVIKDHSALLAGTALPYELKNMLLAGTIIVRGSAHGIVVKTGANTYLAKIAEKAQEVSPETPLTKALNFFAKRYAVLLIGFFLCLLFIGYLQERTPLEFAYILLASLVSAVPEGLPIVITLVMVLGALALSKRQVLVRYLPSVETLGSSTAIATDKTGTITEVKLVVKEVYTHNIEKLQQIAALCNDSHEKLGDPIDVALSNWVQDFNSMQVKFPRKWAFPFDTRHMLMATVNEINGQEELLVKGAYEVLKEKVEDQDELKELEVAFNSFLQQGLRVLAFGIGKLENKDPSSWKIKIIGLIGFLDPPKKGVKEAVAHAKKAGIRVIMITGDHPLTAKAVAHEVGIWSKQDRILTGKEIETLSDDQLSDALKHATVLARTLPEHKYRVVKLLQKQGEIVAVTGDGVNDVPALKAADIGIAMRYCQKLCFGC